MQRRSDLIAIDVVSREAHGFTVYSVLIIPEKGRPVFLGERHSIEACVADLARAYPGKFSRDEFMRMIETQRYSLKNMAGMYGKILLEINTACDLEEIEHPKCHEVEKNDPDEMFFEADDLHQVV